MPGSQASNVGPVRTGSADPVKKQCDELARMYAKRLAQGFLRSDSGQQHGGFEDDPILYVEIGTPFAGMPSLRGASAENQEGRLISALKNRLLGVVRDEAERYVADHEKTAEQRSARRIAKAEQAFQDWLQRKNAEAILRAERLQAAKAFSEQKAKSRPSEEERDAHFESWCRSYDQRCRTKTPAKDAANLATDYPGRLSPTYTQDAVAAGRWECKLLDAASSRPGDTEVVRFKPESLIAIPNPSPCQSAEPMVQSDLSHSSSPPKTPPTQFPPPLTAHSSHLPAQEDQEEGISQEALRTIFDTCDTNGDGQVNKRELILACRAHKGIANFFKLPQQIRQEDGSRDIMERVFQSMDRDDNREVSWEEFLRYVESTS